MKTSLRLIGASLALAALRVSAASTLYVSLESTNPVAPYATWETAATNIQHAVDAAVSGDTVLVTNGVYAVGNRDGNRVVVTNSIRLESVNGPLATTIEGGGTRCVYLGTNAVLSGFTLTNGSAGNGGGVYSESAAAVVSNCTLTDNRAAFGGGAAEGTLYNCTLTGNSAGCWGGGAYDSTLNNCTLTGNSADGGGGASFGTLNNCTLTGNLADWVGGGALHGTLHNCVVYFNTAPEGANYYQDEYGGLLTYCCTTPMPTNGVGNITNAPLLMNAAAGDFRLQSNSPCINAGNNANVTSTTDLDGNPRVSGGIVDMGAYEFVLAPSMEVAQLILLVNDSDLGAKNKQPLLATLSAAMASFDRGNLHSGANQLHAFQNKVRAQVARIDSTLANELINVAQQIIEKVTSR